MPNWVSNNVRIEGSRVDLDALQKLVAGDKSVFSFEKLIPTPPELACEHQAVCSHYILGQLLFYLSDKDTKKVEQRDLDFIAKHMYIYEGLVDSAVTYANKIEPDKIDSEYHKGKVYYERLQKYGAVNWYDFHLEHWGTKWNACDVSMQTGGDILYYQFNTAWSVPFNIFKKLAELFPMLKITDWYSDEDISGEHWGVINCQNGEAKFRDTKQISNNNEATAIRAHLLIDSGAEIESFDDIVDLDFEMEPVSDYLTTEENEAVAKMINDTGVQVGFSDCIGYCVVYNDSMRLDFIIDNYNEDKDDKLFARIKASVDLILKPTQSLN